MLRKIKRPLITGCIILVCFLLESTLFQKLALASITPNLLIVVTSSFGFMRGNREGMIVGFVSGLLIDVMFGDLVGFYALAYMLLISFFSFYTLLNIMIKNLLYSFNLFPSYWITSCQDSSSYFSNIYWLSSSCFFHCF